MLFGQQLGARLAKAHRPAFAAALHPVHEEDPDADQHDEGQPDAQKRHETRLFLRLGPNFDVLGDQPFGDLFVLRLDGCIGASILSAHENPLAINGDAGHLPFIDALHELGIRQIARGLGGGRAVEHVEKKQNQQEQHNPEGDIACVAHRGTP